MRLTRQQNRPKARSTVKRLQSLPNRLRIIGGRWRGARLQFPPLPAIRPTPDRVRETLFNWLQSAVPGARCLDLYAGSGALGFEALSRGAREVVFVDREPAIGRYLRETLQRLESNAAEVHTVDAQKYLTCSHKPFDVVFLDPPFAQAELGAVCAQLEKAGWLAANAHIYVECAAAAGLPPLPESWRLLRSKQAGQVGYHLAHRLGAALKSTQSGPHA